MTIPPKMTAAVMTTIVRVAGEEDLEDLSRRLLMLTKNKNSELYQDNVAKFGIPDDYVGRALSKETLQKAVKADNATFYLAIENDDILGFVQVIPREGDISELGQKAHAGDLQTSSRITSKSDFGSFFCERLTTVPTLQADG